VPERGGQAGCGVGESRRPVGLVVAQVGEERSGEPRLDEVSHGRVAASFQLGRAPVVLGPAQASSRPLSDARVRPDDDEALYEARRLECQMQAAPAAERVADVTCLAARLTERPGRLGESRARAGERRAAVPRKVGHHDLEFTLELLSDARPGAACLSEPVDERDPRSTALPRRVQLELPLPGRPWLVEGHRR